MFTFVFVCTLVFVFFCFFVFGEWGRKEKGNKYLLKWLFIFILYFAVLFGIILGFVTDHFLSVFM